jgi:hypothetical protein
MLSSGRFLRLLRQYLHLALPLRVAHDSADGLCGTLLTVPARSQNRSSMSRRRSSPSPVLPIKFDFHEVTQTTSGPASILAGWSFQETLRQPHQCFLKTQLSLACIRRDLSSWVFTRWFTTADLLKFTIGSISHTIGSM